MRLGILADIHEHDGVLRAALERFQQEHVDQVVVLGDILEVGDRLTETCCLLKDAGAIGVWGNHDFGLSCDPNDNLQDKYEEATVNFMSSLHPRLELEGCLFTHVEPWLDPEDLTDLWYFGGPPTTPEKAALSFNAVPNRVMFIGHLHRWLVCRQDMALDWQGNEPLVLSSEHRYLVVVAAVCDGRYAIYDTDTLELTPFSDDWA